MKWIFFFTLLSSFAAIAQSDYVQNFDMKACATVKRLDSKGELYENVPIQDQGPLNTCYANSASLTLLGAYNKSHPQNKINQLSWMHLAYLTQKKVIDDVTNPDARLKDQAFYRLGDLCPLYNSVKGKKVCELELDYEKHNGKSLEYYPALLTDAFEHFQDFFAMPSVWDKINQKKDIIPPTCIDYLKYDLDKKISLEIIKDLNDDLFNSLLPYKDNAYDDGVFFDALKRKFYFSNFSDLNKIFHNLGTVFNFSPRDEGMRQFFNQSLTNTDEFFSAWNSIKEELETKFLPKLDKLKNTYVKELSSCIDNTLSKKVAPSNENLECREKTDGEKIADQYMNLVSLGYDEKFILHMINYKNLYSRSSLFDEFMNSLYKNCNVTIPNNLICEYESLNKESNVSKADRTFSKVIDHINKEGTSFNLSLYSNFMHKEPEETSGQHMVSVLGYATSCGEKKERCLLIQNSWGTQEKNIADSPFSDDIKPDKKKILKNSELNKTYEYGVYGKFWLCGDDILNKYATELATLKVKK